MLDITKGSHSLSDFKRHTGDLLKLMRRDHRPLVLTINGKAEVVVQDAVSYRQLLDRVDQLEALEGVKRGLADVRAGRTTQLQDFEKEFRRKHGLSRRSR